EAVQQAVSETALSPLTFVSAVEEECTGNGTLAASLAGALADAAVHPEPTGLELLLSGIGLVWFELVVDDRPTHAHVADEGVNGNEAALPLRAARARAVTARALRRVLRAQHRHLPRRRLAVERARRRTHRDPARPAQRDVARRRGAAGAGRRRRGGGRRPVARRPPAPGRPERIPRRGVLPGRRAPARRGVRRRAPRRVRRRARDRSRDGDDGRALLREPLRGARALLRPAGSQHPRARRGGGAGQHRRRRARAQPLPAPLAQPRGRAAVTPDRSPGPLLGPLQLRTTGEQIAERLVTAIALGEFVPGQRLPPERALATMLGVSRRSVREALHSLAGDGYVE